MNFSEKVKETMVLKKIKNAELARMVGHSPQYISDLLSGDRRWNEDTINKVCSALSIEVKYEIQIDGLEEG